MPLEPDEIKSYTVPVFNIDDVKLNPNIIVLKNELGKIRKCSQVCLIRFHKLSQVGEPRRAILETFTFIYALEK